jgi:hypothetical protein
MALFSNDIFFIYHACLQGHPEILRLDGVQGVFWDASGSYPERLLANFFGKCKHGRLRNWIFGGRRAICGLLERTVVIYILDSAREILSRLREQALAIWAWTKGVYS